MPLWARILILTLLGLVSLIGSSLFFSSALNRTAERTARMTELIAVSDAASEAQVAFGELRYWLTDLAVSLLTISERNAEAAGERLDALLDQLAPHDPATVAGLRNEIAAFRTDAMSAVDAYTDDNRVIGNTLLAQARAHSESVDRALTALRRQVNAAAAEERRLVTEHAERFARRALSIVLAMSLVGLLLTGVVVRSIVRPLRRINEAVAALAERRYDVVLPPERNDEFGAIARTLSLFRDTAIARERLEIEHERQRQRLATAIETIPDGFVLYDADENVLIANRKYLTLFPELRDTLRAGVAFRDLLATQVKLAIKPPGQSDADWIGERLARHRDPAGFTQDHQHGATWLRITKRHTPDGGVVAVYTDITLLKTRQEELEVARREAVSASEAKSHFLASMSHELRTPLNAIIGYSEMLIEDARDGGHDDIVPDLEKIAGSGRHLLGLINDVLDLSKIEAGKMEVFAEEFDVEAMVRDVEATIQPLIAKNGNRLEVALAAPLGAMHSDQMKIRQNLLNLLSNAAKFTRNGRIGLSVAREARDGRDWMVFGVDDSGIGMTEDQTAKLFNAFTQADSSTTRLYGGTGLGLSITRSFCRAIGGDIDVRSSPGAGSTFTMAVPARLDQADPRAVADEASAGDYVLIIDDEAAARRLMSCALTKAGFAWREAASGAEGIALARQARPRAIVLDVLMPQQDGWSVLRALKSDPELCEIPVILATVLADRDLGMALGAVEYLVKPIDGEALIATIQSIGRGRGDVLVIDDDEVSRNLLRRILTRQGLRVHEASGGARGLELMRSLRPDIVLLDIIMGEMDGFAVLREVQRTPDLRGTPVIVVTSKDLTGEELGWLRDRAVSVVMKDAETRAQLVEALRRQISALPA